MNSLRASFSVLALLAALAVPAAADICVWRDPDRAMSRLFPSAGDYRTIDVKISPQALARIEKGLGKALGPGERANWIFYAITGRKGEIIGHVLTDAERGQHGTIEIVLGLGVDGKVATIYIQRSRERDKALKSKEFLDQFIGKTVADPLRLGEDIKAGRSVATEQTAFGVRKMLVMYDELKGNPQESGEEIER